MTREQAVNTAINWWAEKLRAKMPHNNGDNSLTSIFACFLADGGMKDIADDSLTRFKEALRENINGDIDKYIIVNKFSFVSLDCDYHPCKALMDAAAIAGISEFNFPYKTCMHIRTSNRENFTVEVKDGYACGFTTLNFV